MEGTFVCSSVIAPPVPRRSPSTRRPRSITFRAAAGSTSSIPSSVSGGMDSIAFACSFATCAQCGSCRRSPLPADRLYGSGGLCYGSQGQAPWGSGAFSISIREARLLDEVRTPRLVIAGTASSVGKTTLAAGLIAALRAQGLTVQSFKVGPDYIDPAYLAHVTGRPCRNLDSWMLGEGALRQVLAQGCLGADLALIEGMLGLFDGRGGSPDGSTADVARIVKAPVVLVVDVADMAQSAAAVALGFKSYGEPPKIAGVLLNNVRSDAHRRSVEDAIWDIAKLPVLGALPKMAQL